MLFNIVSNGLLMLILVNILSVIACLWFLIHFLRLKNKLLSVKMIAVLCLSDLVFHTMFTITYIFHLRVSFSNFADLVQLMIFHFSLFWACNITYLMYKLLFSDAILRSRYYIVSSTIIILGLAIAVTIA